MNVFVVSKDAHYSLDCGEIVLGVRLSLVDAANFARSWAEKRKMDPKLISVSDQDSNPGTIVAIFECDDIEVSQIIIREFPTEEP